MKYSVVIDCLGSDKGPEAIIEGAIKSLNKFDDLFVTLAGPKDLIAAKMAEANIAENRYAILDADETITNYENPTVGIMSKPKASLCQAFREASKDENICDLGSTPFLMGIYKAYMQHFPLIFSPDDFWLLII